MKIIKNQKAITLIVLVITIIILLILAGVALNLVVGENGITERAVKAGKTHNIVSAKEKFELDVANYASEFYQAKYINNDSDATSIQEYIMSKIGDKDQNYAGGYTLTKEPNNNENTIKLTENYDPRTSITATINIDGKVLWDAIVYDDSPEEPQTSTLQNNVNIATTALNDNGITPDTRTITEYLYEQGIYQEGEIAIAENGDFLDTLSVNEETADVPTNRYTVYFQKPDSWNADNVYAYLWYKDSNQNDNNGGIAWPGTKMSAVENDIYKIQLPEVQAEGYSWQNIIFNNGSGSEKQTVDLAMGQKGQIFSIDSNSNIIYSYRVDNWLGPLYVYAWKTDSNNQVTNNAAWPGIEMESVNSNNTIYKYDMGDNGWQYFIINNGTEDGHKQQTFNITYNGGNRIYCVNGKDDYAYDSSDGKNKMKESYNTPYEKALTGQWQNKN